MKEEQSENTNEESTCPPIELGIHQNSYNPKDVEKRNNEK